MIQNNPADTGFAAGRRPHPRADRRLEPELPATRGLARYRASLRCMVLTWL